MALNYVEKEYSKLRKKYNLPDFDKINGDFEIEAINVEENGIFINSIVRVMASKLSRTYLNFLDGLLGPQSSSTYLLIVKKNLGNETREKAFRLYEKIIPWLVESFKVLMLSEKEKVEYINGLFKDCQEFKKDFLEIISDVEDGLKTESKKKAKVGYMG